MWASKSLKRVRGEWRELLYIIRDLQVTMNVRFRLSRRNHSSDEQLHVNWKETGGFAMPPPPAIALIWSSYPLDW